MPNFRLLAGLEEAEDFSGDGRWGGFQVATVSNLNANCFRVALSLVELRYRWILTKYSRAKDTSDQYHLCNDLDFMYHLRVHL